MSSADLMEAEAPPQPEGKKNEGKEPHAIKRWVNGALGVIGMDSKSVEKRHLRNKVSRLFARASELMSQLGQTDANGNLNFNREAELDKQLGEVMAELEQAQERLLELGGEDMEQAIADLDEMLAANSQNDEVLERLVADLDDVQYRPGDNGSGVGATTDFDEAADTLWDQTQRDADAAGIPSTDELMAQLDEGLRREQGN